MVLEWHIRGISILFHKTSERESFVSASRTPEPNSGDSEIFRVPSRSLTGIRNQTSWSEIESACGTVISVWNSIHCFLASGSLPPHAIRPLLPHDVGFVRIRYLTRSVDQIRTGNLYFGKYCKHYFGFWWVWLPCCCFLHEGFAC